MLVMTLLMINLPLLSFLPSSTQYFCISTTQLFARNSWKPLPLQFMWHTQPHNFDLKKLVSDYTLSSASLNVVPPSYVSNFPWLDTLPHYFLLSKLNYYLGHDIDATYHNCWHIYIFRHVVYILLLITKFYSNIWVMKIIFLQSTSNSVSHQSYSHEFLNIRNWGTE